MAKAGPSRWLNVLYAAAVVPFFVLMSSPDGAMSDECTAGWFLIIVGTALAWLPAAVLHVGARGWLWRRSVRRPALRAGWLVIPIVLLVCAVVQDSGALWRLRWAGAKSSFASALRAPGREPRWLGTFSIKAVQRRGNMTVFYLGFPDLYSQGWPEVVYSPDGWPVGFGPVLLDLGEGWYVSFNPT
jgi:hypothetical protein